MAINNGKYINTIRDVTIQIIYNTKPYEIIGKNSVEITSEVSRNIVYNADGTGTGVVYCENLNTPDSIRISMTQPSDSTMKFLTDLYLKGERVDVVLLNKNGSQISDTLQGAIVTNNVYQKVIDASADNKFEVTFKGRLSSNIV